MSTETNKEIVRQFVNAMSTGNIDEIDNLVASGVVYHNPPLDHGEGPEGRKEFTKVLSTVFPQHEETIEDMIAEGDKVAVRWTTRGTHEGSLEGVREKDSLWAAPPTGQEITVTGITIYRIVDGKIAESWAKWDETHFVAQLRGASAT